jgi:hypothetical protein
MNRKHRYTFAKLLAFEKEVSQSFQTRESDVHQVLEANHDKPNGHAKWTNW